MFKKKINILSDKVEPYVDKPVASLFTCHLEHVYGNLVCLIHLGLEIIYKLCYNSKKFMLCCVVAQTRPHLRRCLVAMKSWILSFVVFLIGAILCKAVEDWTADMFPNPQEEPERCGRSRKSFICDPDHILSPDDGWYQLKWFMLPADLTDV